jgi:hypothetical protein
MNWGRRVATSFDTEHAEVIRFFNMTENPEPDIVDHLR